MKRLFLINPNARGCSERAIREAKAFFIAETGSFEYRVASDWSAARDQTRQALGSEGFEQIVALGGDGTVNAAVNGFFENERPIHPMASLAVSDLGTGSDYFRAVRFRSGDWKSAVISPSMDQVDLGLVRFKGSARQAIYFANALTAGITANIVKAKHESSIRLPRKLSYLIPTLSQLLRNQSYAVRLELDDGRVLEKTIVALFLAKGAHLGGGMRLLETADLANSALKLVLVEKMPVVGLIWQLKDFYKKGLKASDTITIASLRFASLLGERPLPVECDGELLGDILFSVEVVPRALRLCR